MTPTTARSSVTRTRTSGDYATKHRSITIRSTTSGRLAGSTTWSEQRFAVSCRLSKPR
jgi:hypothetical protein